MTRLSDELLSGRPSALADPLRGWLESRRFCRFVEDHLPKVRKKLRGASDRETARDLLLELETAFRLVSDKRLSVAYEPTPGGSARGPDFAVRYTTKLQVTLEVTRLRGSSAASGTDGEHATPAAQRRLDTQRLRPVLALKLGQVTVDGANVLLIGTDDAPPSERDLGDLMKALRREAEAGPVEALTRLGFKSRGDYLRRLSALSAIVVRPAPDMAALSAATSAPAPNAASQDHMPEATCWLNPVARTPLPNDVRSALLTALTG